MLPAGLSQIGNLTLFAFAPSQLGVYAEVSGQGADGFVPIAPSDILARAGAVAALDGPQFQNCAGQSLPGGNAAYAASQCGYPQFMVYDARGVSFPSSRPQDGSTVSIVNGQAIVLDNNQIAQGAQVAVQLFPTLVRNGQNVASNVGSNATAERRAALAVFPDGQLAFVVGADDMVGFAESIRQLGANYAGYTDGGGSTALVTTGGTYGAGQRPVPTWLIATPPTSGTGAIIGAIVVAGIVGGLLYATTRIKTRSNPAPSEALRYLESQPEALGWPGDVEIVTIPYDSRAPIRSFAKDRSIYPLREIQINKLIATQPTVDRAFVAKLLRTGESVEPILVTPYGVKFAIQDGHHRAYAASLRGDATILARVARIEEALPSPRGPKPNPAFPRDASLWKYNRITGTWDYQRDVTNETAEQWLAVFQRDERGEVFRIAKTMPKSKPKEEKAKKRDEELARVAREKAASPGIGHPLWLPSGCHARELRIKRSFWSIFTVNQKRLRSFGQQQKMHLVRERMDEFLSRATRTHDICTVAHSGLKSMETSASNPFG